MRLTGRLDPLVVHMFLYVALLQSIPIITFVTGGDTLPPLRGELSWPSFVTPANELMV